MAGIRRGIKRFFGANPLSDKQFVKILLKLVDYGTLKDGTLTIPVGVDKYVSIIEKMDGMFVHIGVTPKSVPYMATSGGDLVTAQTTDSLFLHEFARVADSGIMRILKGISSTIAPVRISGELLSRRLGTAIDDSTFFNAISYANSKLGREGAIVVFDVEQYDPSTGRWGSINDRKKESILQRLKGVRCDHFKVYTNLHDAHKLTEISFDLFSLYPHLVDPSKRQVLEQTFASGKSTKIRKRLKPVIETTRKTMQAALDTCANTYTSFLSAETGVPPEGLILRIHEDDLIQIKGTSARFDKAKQAAWEIGEPLGNLYDTLEAGLWTIIGVPKKEFIKAFPQAVTLAKNEHIDGNSLYLNSISIALTHIFEVGDKLSALQHKQLEELIGNVLREFLVLSDIEPSNQHAVNIAQRGYKKFIDLSKAASIASSYTDLIANILPVKLKPQNVKAVKPHRPRAIIWVGRAQPWHIGHHRMLEQAKAEASRVGAEMVIICLVKGTETSKDKSRNPLTFKQQTMLLNSIYKDDPQVRIGNSPALSAWVGDVFAFADRERITVAGVIAGEDRFPDYLQDFTIIPAKESLHMHGTPYETIDGYPNIDILLAERVMSATEARSLTSRTTFETWMKIVAPFVSADLNLVAYNAYRTIFRAISETT